MLRTVVHQGPPRTTTRRTAGSGEAAGPPRDGYREKLVKYVPVEVLAVFVPLSAAAKDTRWLAWTVLAAGAVCSAGYLVYHATGLPVERRPPAFTYAISVVAFGLWAAGTSDPVRQLLHLAPTTAEVLLGLGALVLPLVDGLCEQSVAAFRLSRDRTASRAAAAR